MSESRAWKDQPGSSDELAMVIEKAMEPIEEAFSSVLEGVHEHGAREEREAVVRWLRSNADNSSSYDETTAAAIEAGEHRKEADRG